MKKTKNPPAEKVVTTLLHDEASRKNIPTAEFQSVMRVEEQRPIRVAYERRNRDLDPQLIWRGKYPNDDIDAELPLTVPAPPLYIQEKVHPKALIDDLKRETERKRAAAGNGLGRGQIDLFADFNGLPSGDARTEFYQHDQHWSNRMILGDSLQVMASLAEREGLRGRVQCIYFDPPYGIRFNSNFQWSTTSRDVKDGNIDHITREPEQVKAFRDTWRDGIHSYLTYLRERLVVARDLLSESGCIFVQIGDENVHRVRAVLDEVFGSENYVAQIVFRKTSGKASDGVDITVDFLLMYARRHETLKLRPLYEARDVFSDQNMRMVQMPDGRRRGLSKLEATREAGLPDGARVFRNGPITSSRPAGDGDLRLFTLNGVPLTPGKGTFKSNLEGLTRLSKADRLLRSGNTLGYVRFFEDFSVGRSSDIWDDTRQSGFGDPKTYVVQTASRVLERCILMATDPGDLVLDPTCGSGTTAYVAEQWGRRWITIDTSRVALALARARVMGARYSYYLLADSPEGRLKEAQLQNLIPADTTTNGDIRQGFVYERVPHVTLKSIANNCEIDVIWEDFQTRLEPLRERLNTQLGEHWQEWDIPREALDVWSKDAKQAGDAGFDVIIACAFNFDAQSAEFNRLGRIPVLKARMNADLHMAEDLKNTGKGNLFIIFGEPEINILPAPHDEIRVKLNGIDVFNPSTGQVTSSEPDDIACWFVDTDYNEESFFVRHAYFLGANDPYKALKTTLKAEINQEAWESLHSDTSRPFPKPSTGRIAVKVINHLGDEVMKVFTVA
jgi:adenine-specific DNA-methyltransferase